MNYFTGKRVVVTGAGGSIGSQICEQLVRDQTTELTLLSLTESGLYNVTRKLRAMNGSTDIIPVLGSITDAGLVSEVTADKDIVIHAAAHKHVPICEDNPIEAVKNNVFGTRELIHASIDNGVQQFLQISSDKAVRPRSVMGATKRLCELLIMKAMRSCPDTDFSVVRFGNVMDSAGSVLPLWREQLQRGEPLTVTDRHCTRYFMSIAEACELVLEVLKMQRTGLFVFDMGEPKNIYEMACNIVSQTGLTPAAHIKLIGLRPGEKLTEELDYGGTRHPTEHPKVFQIAEDESSSQYLYQLHELEQFVKTRRASRVVESLMELVR